MFSHRERDKEEAGDESVYVLPSGKSWPLCTVIIGIAHRLILAHTPSEEPQSQICDFGGVDLEGGARPLMAESKVDRGHCT